MNKLVRCFDAEIWQGTIYPCQAHTYVGAQKVKQEIGNGLFGFKYKRKVEQTQHLIRAHPTVNNAMGTNNT